MNLGRSNIEGIIRDELKKILREGSPEREWSSETMAQPKNTAVRLIYTNDRGWGESWFTSHELNHDYFSDLVAKRGSGGERIPILGTYITPAGMSFDSSRAYGKKDRLSPDALTAQHQEHGDVGDLNQVSINKDMFFIDLDKNFFPLNLPPPAKDQQDTDANTRLLWLRGRKHDREWFAMMNKMSPQGQAQGKIPIVSLANTLTNNTMQMMKQLQKDIYGHHNYLPPGVYNAIFGLGEDGERGSGPMPEVTLEDYYTAWKSKKWTEGETVSLTTNHTMGIPLEDVERVIGYPRQVKDQVFSFILEKLISMHERDLKEDENIQ